MERETSYTPTVQFLSPGEIEDFLGKENLFDGQKGIIVRPNKDFLEIIFVIFCQTSNELEQYLELIRVSIAFRESRKREVT